MESTALGPVMLDFAGHTLDAEDSELLRHPLVGGCILFTRNYAEPAQLRALVQSIRAQRPDCLIAVDYEGGRVQRFREGFTRIPAMRRLGAIMDQSPAQACSLASHCGWLTGSELRSFDIDLSFAPVLDVDTGISVVIGDRAFHSEPQAIIELALHFMRGMQQAGMAATGKHYPGHGHVAPDSHQELPVDARRFDELAPDLAPFDALIRAGIPSIMMAHIRYPQVDQLPASLSRYWVNDILRGRSGFHGAVFTDDLSMGGAAAMGSYLDRASLALEAGCDMLPVCNHRPGVVELLDGLPQQISTKSAQRLHKLRGTLPIPENLPQLPAWQAAVTALAELEALA